MKEKIKMISVSEQVAKEASLKEWEDIFQKKASDSLSEESFATMMSRKTTLQDAIDILTAIAVADLAIKMVSSCEKQKKADQEAKKKETKKDENFNVLVSEVGLNVYTMIDTDFKSYQGAYNWCEEQCKGTKSTMDLFKIITIHLDEAAKW